MKFQMQSTACAGRSRLPRALFVCASLVALLSLCAGQRIVGKIGLPDSFGLSNIGRFPVQDTSLGKVYLAGSGAVCVLDGPNGHPSKRISLCGAQLGGCGSYLYPALHKLYVIADYDTLVSVIDTRTDSVLKTMTLPDRRLANMPDVCACLNTRDGKLYVDLQPGDECAVFDAVHDTLLHVIRPMHGSWMCYDPVTNELFAHVNNWVFIYDADADTLLDSLPAGNGATGIACLTRCNKVYVTNMFGGDVTIIDGAGDSLIKQHDTTGGMPTDMWMNEHEGKVYVDCLSQFAIIDGFSDSVKVVQAPGGAGLGTWNSRTGRAAMGCYDGSVLVLDGATDSVLSRVATGPWLQPGGGAVINDRRNLVYFVGYGGTYPPRLTAIDGLADTFLWSEVNCRMPYGPSVWARKHRELYFLNPHEGDAMSVGEGPYQSPHSVADMHVSLPSAFISDRAGERLYCCAESLPAIYVVSCSLHRVVDSITLMPNARPVVLCTGIRPDRLYCGYWVNDDPITYGVAVIDTKSNEVVRTFPCGNLWQNTQMSYGDGAFSDSSGKFYIPSAESLLIINAQTDSVVKSLPVAQSRNWVTDLCWDSRTNCIYVSTSDVSHSVKVVDCRNDSIVAGINTGNDVVKLLYVPRVNKLYALHSGGAPLTIIDCDQNQVVGSVYVPGGLGYLPPVYNPLGNKVYFVGSSPSPVQRGTPSWYLVAVDCATNRVVSDVPIGYQPGVLAVDPDSGYIFAGCNNSVLYEIQDQTPAGVAAGATTTPKTRPGLRVYPSPSIRGVTIEAVVPQMALTMLTIYDDVGRIVAAPVSEQFGPGNLEVQWDGSSGGKLLPGGVYYARLETGNSRIIQKFVLTR